MRKSFDHRPPGWIGQSRKRCTQSIHNQMVVDYFLMSSKNFQIPAFPIFMSGVIAPGANECGADFRAMGREL